MTELGVRGIRVVFGGTRGTVALDDVTLDVPAGEVTAVVGGDGAGKSTLLRVLAGRVGVQAGEVRTLGKGAIGYQPSTSGVWGGLTVAENLAFVGQSFGMSLRALRVRGGDLLERAGLADARGRLGRDLSGGMRQKLGFVLAIVHAPRLVLLDEPSTGVDPVSRVELSRLIAEAATGDTAVLLATTYLDEAARAATVTALDAGAVIASGTPDEVVASVPGRIVVTGDSGPRTWQRGTVRHRWVPGGTDAGVTPDADAPIDLEDALIALTLARAAPPATRREAREARAGAGSGGDAGSGGGSDSRGAARVSRRVADGRSPSGTTTTRDPRSETQGQVVAAGRGVTRRFGAQVAVDDVSVEVRAGEIVGLIGANGAGKTTFLRCLIGLDAPDAGAALLFGAPPTAASRERLGYVPQGLGLYRTISVDANADFFSRVYRMPEPTLPAGIADVRHEPVGAIGLGRQRQLAFTLALAHRPELLVLDEPTSGVDPLSRARLWDIVHAQADAGVGVIVTTHYLQEAEQCTRLALLSQGRLVGTGSVAELTAGVTATLVTADDWQRAFAALGAAGLPTMLSGRSIRVAGAPAGDVRHALAGIPARIEEVAPTLEEAMVLREA
ncbi:ATP-binding cassette domain-containing protein [Microbacterium aurum]|uniref:ATP-binding cassette domain-containing protein n=1 Tax=Microbacterium aurum TaxID=36805 RepID=UPI001EF50BB5|nr:ATP-binding cassette domain-containing protein [Microbacterium aurum]MCG7413161.1 ATP-binding cassette domain-containing protein [Microbacterium aurum]